MLCKDNMANLDFKSKKNNAKHIFLPFSSFFFFSYIYIYYKKEKQKQLNMEWMNVTQCKS